MSNTLDRRKFIKQGSAAALGFAFLPSMSHKVAPSDKVRIAHIGLGGMGNNHLKWFAALPEVEIVALCDVDEDHLNSTFKTLQTLTAGNKSRLIRRFSSCA